MITSRVVNEMGLWAETLLALFKMFIEYDQVLHVYLNINNIFYLKRKKNKEKTKCI